MSTTQAKPRTQSIQLWIAVPLVLLAWNLLLPDSARAQDAVPTDSIHVLIQSLYDNGSFVSAELEARRLLDQGGLGDSSRILAEQFVAFSLIAQGKNTAATEYFVSILKKDSAYSLDPLMTSPKIMSVFEHARQRYNQEKSALVQPAVKTVDPPRVGPSFRLVLFPGWDQIHQGRTTKGTILLSAGAVSLGSLVTFDLLRRSARDEYLAANTPDEASAKYRDYDRYSKAEYYSAAALLVVYAYSAFDAFFDLPPRIDAETLPDGSAMKLSLQIPF